MTSREHHYQDMLLRWLSVKREMPWNTEDEPTPNILMDISIARERLLWEVTASRMDRLRKRTIFDFERSK